MAKVCLSNAGLNQLKKGRLSQIFHVLTVKGCPVFTQDVGRKSGSPCVRDIQLLETCGEGYQWAADIERDEDFEFT
jgi:hypothetical protein